MRESVCLNGYWDFAVCASDELSNLPKVYDGGKILVPSPFNINSFTTVQTRSIDGEDVILKGAESNLFPEYDQKWEDAKAGHYCREFFVPKEWENRKVTLKFNGVLFYSEYYVNKKLVHTDYDGFLPVEIEINDYIKFGENNEIIVAVKNAHEFMIKNDGKNMIEYPKGSFWGERMTGIWQDVYLQSYPKSYINDVFVTTDILNCDCKIQVELQGEVPEGGKLDFKVSEYKGEKTFDFESAATTAETVQYTYNYSAVKDKIKLWGMREPNLYYMTVTMLDKDGNVLDSKRVRFGFRTVGVKGKKIYLNGVPVVLKQDSWHYMGFMYQTEEYARKWYEMEFDANVNTVRLHAQPYPEFFLDIADEMGMLIVGESAVWGSHCQFHNSDRFIEMSQKHVERMIKRDRNHPSIVVWSIENECLRAYGVSRDNAVKNVEELAERLALIGIHARKFDSTRIYCAEGSRDLGGTMDLYSMHYSGLTSPETDKPVSLGEMGTMYYSTPSSASDYIGQKAFYSRENRLENLGQEAFYTLKHQRKWASGVCIFNIVWYGLNPLRFKERMLTYDDYTTPGIKISKIGEFMGTINAGYDPELPDYSPNPVFPWVKKAFEAERTFFEEEQRSFYSEEKAIVKISVHNDSLQTKNYNVKAKLYNEKQQVLEIGINIEVSPAEYALVDIKFDCPHIDTVSKYKLELQLNDSVNTVNTDCTDIKIFNRDYLKSLLPKNATVAIAGNCGKAMSDMFRHIDSYEENKYAAVIVCDGISEELYGKIINGTAAVIDFTAKHDLLKGKIHNKNIRKGFFTNADQGISLNLSDEDLSGVVGDLFADKHIDADLNVNFAQLITSGNGEPVVVELLAQNRVYIASTSPFININNLAALQLLINLINYAQKPVMPLSDCTVISNEGSVLHNLFTSIGLSFTLISPSEKALIKSVKGTNVMIADGSGDLEYINELTLYNTKNLHIFGLENESIPRHMKGFFTVENQKGYQFKLNENNGFTSTILASDLYGTDRRAAMTVKPIKIHDNIKCKNIASTADVDWRAWNDIAEERKTISILRTEIAQNENLALFCGMTFNGMDVFINQLDITRDESKIRITLKKLLTNMGLRFDSNAEIEEPEVLYDQKLIKNTMVNVKSGDSEIIEHDSGRVIASGIYDHSVFVFSLQDRTDLLRNPDLIYMEYESEFDTEFYLEDKLLAEGKIINLNVLPLKQAKNKLVFRQKRDKDSDKLFTLKIKRKRNLPLDVKFFLTGE